MNLLRKSLYPVEIHSEITELIFIYAIGTHDSFAFYLTNQPGPDLAPNLRRIRIFIHPIIKNWSITQNKTFTGSKTSLKKFICSFY
jgi:hypothetical protein